MDIYRNTTYDEEYLNKVELPELIFQLERYLDGFLSLLKEENLDVKRYVTSLTDALRSNIPESISIALPEPNEKCTLLTSFPELREKCILYYLSVINIGFEEAHIPEGSLEIPFYQTLKGRLLSAYLFVSTLTSITSYEEAILLFQKYMEICVETDPTLDFTLDEVEYLIEGAKMLYGKTHHFTAGMLKKGIAVWKAEKCMWHEILKACGDSKLAYAIACHADFKMAKKLNPNFTLSRTQTLILDAQYCDFCWYDQRIVKDFEHPPKAFWDNFK